MDICLDNDNNSFTGSQQLKSLYLPFTYTKSAVGSVRAFF